MTTIGIRELRQNASKYIALVKSGECVEITDRGRPVARLMPVAEEPVQEPEDQPQDILDRLLAQGIIKRIPPGRGIVKASPKPRKPGQQALSEVLAEMRADERY
jgi:prevent-host-death family protein